MFDLKVLDDNIKAASKLFKLKTSINSNKSDKNYPFPIMIKTKIKRPESAKQFDLEYIKIQLHFKKINKLPTIQITNKDIPKQLIIKMIEYIESYWYKLLKNNQKKQEEEEDSDKINNPRIIEILNFITIEYANLLKLCSNLLEMYFGVDEHGETLRKFALLSVKEIKVENKVKIKELTAEQLIEKEKIRLKRQKEKELKAQELLDEKLRLGEERRKYVEETGYEAPKIQSKKEMLKKKKHV